MRVNLLASLVVPYWITDQEWFSHASGIQRLVNLVLCLLLTMGLSLPINTGLATDDSDDAVVQASHIVGGVCAPIQGVTSPVPAGCTVQSAGGPPGTVPGQNVGSTPGSFFYVAQRNDASHDRADCPSSTEAQGAPGAGPSFFAPLVGTARYVVTLVSDTAGVLASGSSSVTRAQIASLPPITNGTVTMIGVGTNNLGTVVATSSSGDFENAAFDGIDQGLVPPPGPYNFNAICTDPADVPPNFPSTTTGDGHLNDYYTPYLKSHAGNAFNGGTGSTEQHLWQMLVAAPGHQSVMIDLAGNGAPANAVTDDLGASANGTISTRGLPGPPSTGADPQCGIDTFGCNIGLGTIALPPVPLEFGLGTVTGTVYSANGIPLTGVTVVLTDSQGTTYSTRTSPGGFYFFINIYPGPATAIYADNLNEYGAGASAGGINFGPATGCPNGTPCGHIPSVASINVPNTGTVGKDVTLQIKFAPSAAEAILPAGTSGLFGNVVSAAGQGLGGVTITAQLCTAAGTPVGCTAANTAVGAVTPPSVQSAFTTGRWVMSGLTPGGRYLVTASGPGLDGRSCNAPNPPDPKLTAGNTCIDEVVIANTAGRWTDPTFIISGPINALPAPTPTVTPVVPPASVALRLDPAGGSRAVGERFVVQVWADAGGQQLDSAQVQLTFNPAVLQVVDSDPATVGVQAADGNGADPAPLPNQLINTVDNATGVISYAAGRLSACPCPNGSVPITRITFQATSLGSSNLAFVTTGAVRTELAFAKQIVPFTVTNGVYEVVPPQLTGSIVILSRPGPPNVLQTGPLLIRVYAPGGQDPVATLSTTANENGGFTISGLPSGTFDVEVKPPMALGARVGGLTLGSGLVSHNFGSVPTGDADNNNRVSAADFSTLKARFGQAIGCARANPLTINCPDFDANGTVSPADFTILKLNFGAAGPLLIS
jgi:hypothetical protein